MRDSFERIFNLVKTSFGREDGGLVPPLAMHIPRRLAALTRESYLRDILASYLGAGKSGQSREGVEAECGQAGVDLMLTRAPGTSFIRVGGLVCQARPLFDVARAAKPKRYHYQRSCHVSPHKLSSHSDGRIASKTAGRATSPPTRLDRTQGPCR